MGSAPTPPSPSQGIALGSQVAGQQQGINTQAGIQSQQGSEVNQSNPYGSLNYTQTMGPNGVPITTATTTLAPNQQALLNQLQGTQLTAGQQAGSLLGAAGYGGATPAQEVGNMASGLEGQMMGMYAAGTQPMQQTAVSMLDTQLRNQGLSPGEPGYDNAMRSLVTTQTQANDVAAANYANTAFGQANTLYQEPMQMAESLGQFGAPTTAGNPTGTFANAPGLNIQPANLIGATSSEQDALNQQYAAQMQQYSGMMNGLFGIGADALGLMTGGMSTPFTSMASGMMSPANWNSSLPEGSFTGL